MIASLQNQLDKMTASTRALVPPERLQPLEELVASLLRSGIAEQILPAGADAPRFRLQSAVNKPVALDDLLALGPVVLKFFRGRWDAYDMTELEAWEALQPALRERRALFVALSPQLPRQNAFTADRHHLSFPLLTDAGAEIAAAYGLAYAVSERAQRYYRSILVNLPPLHGDASWRLPLPATFLLRSSGSVAWREAYADFRLRPEPEHVLRAIDSLRDPDVA